MPPILNAKRLDIEDACRRNGVARLDIFGSAVAGGFNDATSDFDFLVSFKDEERSKAFDNYFGLRERLEEILGRPVDLVTAASLRNPYLKREIDKQRQSLYAA